MNTTADYLEIICKEIAEQLGPCPKCGLVPAVCAVFENNESNEVIGFKILCKCNCNIEEGMTQEEMAALRLYTLDEITDILKNHKNWHD